MPVVNEKLPYLLDIAPGWNMIGNPFNVSISWSDVLEINGNPTAIGTLKHYSAGTYAASDVLKPYYGAFVNNSGTTAVRLKIPVTVKKGGSRTGKVSTEAIDDSNWVVSLTATDGIIRNELPGFGMNVRASIGMDQFDETPLPSPEGLNTFEMTIGKTEKQDLIKDIVPPATAYSWNGNVTSDSGLTFEWAPIPDGIQKMIVLEIEGNAGLIDMKTTNSVWLAKGQQSFRIHYGTQEYIHKITISKDALAGTISPNPIHRTSSAMAIPVSIPEGGASVGVKLTDLTGKTYTPTNGKVYDEGRHLAEINSDLSELSPGIYIIQISITGRSFSRSFQRKVIID